MSSLDRMTLTVVIKASDVNSDPAPRRNWDHYRLTGFVPNDERGIPGTVLRSIRALCHRQLPSMQLQTRAHSWEASLGSHNVLYRWEFRLRNGHSGPLRDAYAVTLLSLGVSSWVYACGYRVMYLRKLRRGCSLTGKRPSGRTS